MTGVVVQNRGGIVESRHRIHGVVVNEAGERVVEIGASDGVTFLRSAAKPFQALPLVEEGVVDRFGLSGEELALCCGSHNGEPRHLEAAASILRRAGLGPGDLECGPHRPMGEEAARALEREGREAEPIHNNCSGKHAGMLALAVAMEWPTRGYVGVSHPVQERMLDEIVRWSGIEGGRVGRGTDGCGVVTFALPLVAMARSYARLAAAAARGDPGPERVVEAMRCHPFYVAGRGRLCTALLEGVGDRLFAKVGAQGVYCAGVPDEGLGVAVKVEDGGRTAAEVALLHLLQGLDLVSSEDLGELAEFARPPIRNTRGERVGEYRPEFEVVRRG